jgi:hypothetical protein
MYTRPLVPNPNPNPNPKSNPKPAPSVHICQVLNIMAGELVTAVFSQKYARIPMRSRLQPYPSRLQPYVIEAATLAIEAATVCDRSCHPLHTVVCLPHLRICIKPRIYGPGSPPPSRCVANPNPSPSPYPNPNPGSPAPSTLRRSALMMSNALPSRSHDRHQTLTP